MSQTLRWAVSVGCLSFCVAFAGPWKSCFAEGDAKRKRERVELAIYDVREITTTRVDYSAPIFVSHVGAPVNPFASTACAVNTGAPDLAQLIQERMLAEDFADPATSIEEQGGKLVVMQYPSVHQKIKAVLQGFHARFTRRIAVQGLEMALSPAKALDWLGQAGRRQDPSKVTALLKKGSEARLVSAPQFVAFDGQLAHVLAGKQTTYTTDMGSGAGCFISPLDVLLEGMVFQARATLGPLSRRVVLDLKFMRSRPLSIEKREFESVSFERATLKNTKKDPGNGKEIETTELETPPQSIARHKVRIDLPRQIKREIKETLHVPLNAWILAGMLDPVRGGGKDDPEAKVLLLFVRCELVREFAGAK